MCCNMAITGGRYINQSGTRRQDTAWCYLYVEAKMLISKK